MKKLRNLLVAIAMLTAFCGMTAFAADKEVALTNNKWYIQTPDTDTTNYDEMIYHKIAVKQTSYVRIQGNVYYSDGKPSSLSFQMLDAKKRVLNDYQSCSSYNKYTSHFALKRGIYYVAVKGYNDNYRVRFLLSSAKEKSGSKKSKAVKIKKGKTIKGYVLNGESTKKYDWYKISLTKKQKLRLVFGARATGYIRFEIIPASKRVRLFGNTGYANTTTGKYETRSKLPKGTYYVKIYKSTTAKKQDSGLYTFKWY